jgi:hypothetical protein
VTLLLIVLAALASLAGVLMVLSGVAKKAQTGL